MFDPWNVTSAEDIKRAAAEWDAAGGEPLSPLGPWAQYVGAEHVKALRKEIEGSGSTSGFATLSAVRSILASGLVAPDWLVYAFTRRYDIVLNCRAMSWDDPAAFGSPYPKGSHQSALRKARVKRFAVLNAVRAIQRAEPGEPINADLFARVGCPLGLGKTLAERYYYEAVAMLPEQSPRGVVVHSSRSPAKTKKVPGRLARSR